MTLPQRVSIVEVGPRDGLQSEARILPPQVKAELIHRLAEAGLERIEAGSFVSPSASPQMTGTTETLALCTNTGARLGALVPNIRGLTAARGTPVRDIAIFASASEEFSQRNINCTISQSLARYREVVAAAHAEGYFVRGYLSCAWGCPYEGNIDPVAAARVARDLFDFGCDEIALADTIGVAAPLQARALVERVSQHVPMGALAVHFHDSYGQALANVFACVEAGVTTVDAAVAGLGGCPFAPGATGNLATEEVVYMLEKSGVETGVSLEPLIAAGDFICAALGRRNASRVATALRGRGSRRLAQETKA